MVFTPEPGTLSHYNYDPSFEAAIAVGVLYSLAFFVTFFQWLRYNAGVWAIMVVAAAMEGAGYIIRALSTKHVTEKSIYVAQTALIVLSPVLMAAACYIIFGRIIYHIVPKEARTTKLLRIPPRFITPIFVVCDILALLLQLIGVVRITSIDITSVDAQSKLTQGKNIALVGVAIQMAWFGLFSIIAIRFNFTSRRFTSDFQQRITLPNDSKSKNEEYVIIDGAEKKLKPNWQALLHVVNITCMLILIRSVFRMVDFALGRTGYTEEHEWCLYVFDALPIFPCVALFNYWHPAKYLPYLQWGLPKHPR
ncbi:RTA1 domain containing protein (7-aminocholesterol resistance protein) [Botrytis cinerea]